MSDDAQKQLLARRKAALGPAYRLFYREPLHLVRGEGVWLFDANGRKYLDMYNNVAHVGHCHPHVVRALCEQIGTLNTHTRYLHENVVRYAERLSAKFSNDLDTVMFACTGSEANELALRLARRYTGGRGVITTGFAYHGNTQAIYEVSTEDIPPAEVPDYVVAVPYPDVYRGEYRGADAGARYAAMLHAAIATLRERNIQPAAFIVDTIISSSGVVEPPAGYLAGAANIIRDAGGLFIADEVQPGFGRTGENFWGYEADAAVPDIVTMGKPMGNGHPVAAVATRSEIVEDFAQLDGYFNTFGGNPVSAAAALAVLDVIENENLQQNALDVGRYLKSSLAEMAKDHEAIGDVRGNGLFIAVDLVSDRESRQPDPELAASVINQLKDRGVLTGRIGPHENILKFRPPMVVSKANIDFMLEQLAAIL